MVTTLDKDKSAARAGAEKTPLSKLQERIESGAYPNGMRIPTERALADEFGVGRSAIRTALVSLEERGMIVRKPGMRPRVSGRAQSPGRASGPTVQPSLQTIAAIVPQHPIYLAALSIVSGIHHLLRQTEAPQRLIVFDTHGPTWEQTQKAEMAALNALEQEGISGAIVWHDGEDATLQRIRQMQESGYPFVFIDRCPPSLDCDFVGADNRAAAQDAVDHLYSLGHRRIGYLTNQEKLDVVLQREEGYREAMLAYGLAPSPDLIYHIRESVEFEVPEAAKHFLSLAQPPTAVFTMNDLLAHHFIAAAEALGRRVPENLSVVGCDDLERFAARPAMLTTLRQPFEAMGQRAADLLLSRLGKAEGASAAYQHILLPARLVVRSTCRKIQEGRSE